MTAKTTAQNQAAFRARRAAQGLTEVRGIFLPKAKHAGLKAAAKKMCPVKAKKIKETQG